MFGLREFTHLAPGATVVNVGRGQAIDETGLLQALREGRVGRAVIDTFRQEPLAPDSPMWDAPNITITPHMAGAVYPHELARVIAPNIRSFQGGQIPEPIVDRRVGY
jgi:phosphoglycerate dehydrogenase-like enzyme